MLSPEDNRRIQNVSLIPAAIVVYIAIAVMIYLVDNGGLRSAVSYMIFLGILFFFAFPFALFFTRIVLISRKTKTPLSRYRKQFFGKMTFSLIIGGSFGCFLSLFYFALSNWVGQDIIIGLTAAATFAVLGLMITRYRRKFEKLYGDGENP